MSSSINKEHQPVIIDRDLFDGFASGTTSTSHLTRFWHTGLDITADAYYPDTPDWDREKPTKVDLSCVLESMRSYEAGNQTSTNGLGPTSWNLYADLVRVAMDQRGEYARVLEWDPAIHPFLSRKTGDIAVRAVAQLDDKYRQVKNLQ